MIYKFNQEEYVRKVRNAFTKVLKSSAFKFNNYADEEHAEAARVRGKLYMPGRSLCENADAICFIATIGGTRSIYMDGKMRKYGVIMQGNQELLIDYSSLTDRLFPFTGKFGDDAYRSVNRCSFVRSKLYDSNNSLISIFENEENIGKECMVRYILPTYNSKGEKCYMVAMDALWCEDDEEDSQENDIDYEIYHDSTLDDASYTGSYSCDDESNASLEDYIDDDDIEDECDNDEIDVDMCVKYALMKSQVLLLEYIIKYPMAAAAISCEVFTTDDIYLGEMYGEQQAEIVDRVFNDEFRDVYELRLYELKKRLHVDGFLEYPSKEILWF